MRKKQIVRMDINIFDTWEKAEACVRQMLKEGSIKPDPAPAIVALNNGGFLVLGTIELEMEMEI